MGRVAKELADRVIVTNDNPRSEEPIAIVEEILQGAGTDVEVDLDRRSAIETAIEGAEEGDVVLIAGKGHEQGQEIGGETPPVRRPRRRPGRAPRLWADASGNGREASRLATCNSVLQALSARARGAAAS